MLLCTCQVILGGVGGLHTPSPPQAPIDPTPSHHEALVDPTPSPPWVIYKPRVINTFCVINTLCVTNEFTWSGHKYHVFASNTCATTSGRGI